MNISKIILLLPAVVLLSQVQSKPTSENCKGCLKPGNTIFDCKDMTCKNDEKCIEGYREENKPAECVKKMPCPALDCRMQCPNDFVTTPDGCQKCECDGPIGPNPPPQSCAAITCETGTVCKVLRKTDCYPHSDCPMIAQCVKHTCPPVCRMFCEHGNVKDRDGCSICKCNPPPPPKCSKNSDCLENQVCDQSTKTCGCSRIMCDLYCEDGYEQLNGCNTCKCKEAMSCREKKCPEGDVCVQDNIQCFTAPCNQNPRCVKKVCPPVCEMFCEHGNVKDRDGCSICECNPPPSQTCSKNSDCLKNQVCDQSTKTCGCSRIMCAMYCENGFEQLNGCAICKCKEAMSCLEKKCGTGEVCVQDDIQCVTTPCNQNPRCELATCERCRPDEECQMQNVVCKKAPCPKFAKCVPNKLCKKCREHETCMIIQPMCIPGFRCSASAKCIKRTCKDIRCRLGQVCKEDQNDLCLVPPCPSGPACVTQKPGCASMLCQVGHICEENADGAKCVMHPLCKEANCRKDQDCNIITPRCVANEDCPEPIGKCVDRITCELVLCKLNCEFGWKKDRRTGCEICSCADSCEDVKCPIDKFCVEADSLAKCQACPVYRCKGCLSHQEYIRDERGCKTCECKDKECPKVECTLFCKNGLKKNRDGCDICQCEEPKTCKDIKCGKGEYCEMSITCMAIGCPPSRPICQKCRMIKCIPCKQNEENVIDENGCKTCRCKSRCPEVDCVNRCTTGYATDKNGCKSCICNGPEPKTCDYLKCPKDKFCEMTCQGADCHESVPVCKLCPQLRCRSCNNDETTVLDKNGCRTCECKPNNSCRQLDCAEIICQNGMKTDKDGCQTCDCNPAPPQPTCDNYRCTVPGTKCELIYPPCARPPTFCDNKPCVTYCHPVPVCTVEPTPPTCANMLCPLGTICEMQKVECVKEPCYPQPTCVDNPLCVEANCREDQECIISVPKCSSGSAKCDGKPIAECIAKDPCTLIDCRPNQTCKNGKCECLKYPCRTYCKYGYEQDDNGCNICKCRKAPECEPLPCRMNCEYGLVRDKYGCDKCECAAAPKCATVKCGRNQECQDGNCVCKPVLCEMFCEHGWAKDEESGCEICQCALPPPSCLTVKCDKNHECVNGECVCKPVMCKLFCEYGWAKDEKSGCEICQCARPPPPCATVKCDRNHECKDGECVCKPVMCRKFCKYGWAKDERSGCEICQCAPSPLCATVKCGRNEECQDGKCVCKPVLCDMYCKHGWAKDEESGCEICQCAPSPLCATVKCGRNEECQDGKCVCKPVMCRRFCKYGWAKDEKSGCDICQCAPSPLCATVKCDKDHECRDGACVCKPIMCRMHCKYGWAKDEKSGCDKCQCAPPPTCATVKCDKNQECKDGKCVCKPVLCRMRCENGWARDEKSGCEICGCAPSLNTNRMNCPKLSCGNLNCQKYAVDRNGCEICDCVKKTVNKTSCPNSLCKNGERCTQEEVCDPIGLTCTTKRFCVFGGGMLASMREIE